MFIMRSCTRKSQKDPSRCCCHSCIRDHSMIRRVAAWKSGSAWIQTLNLGIRDNSDAGYIQPYRFMLQQKLRKSRNNNWRLDRTTLGFPHFSTRQEKKQKKIASYRRNIVRIQANKPNFTIALLKNQILFGNQIINRLITDSDHSFYKTEFLKSINWKY